MGNIEIKCFCTLVIHYFYISHMQKLNQLYAAKGPPSADELTELAIFTKGENTCSTVRRLFT